MHLLLTIATIHLAALVLPGPDVFLVSQTALARGRRAALLAGLGICLGIAVWATAALAGINLLFQWFPWLHGIIKIAGGLYLLYLGFNLWRSSLNTIETDSAHAPINLPLSDWAALRAGFLTNLANPKAAIFFSSIFSSVLPAHTPNSLKVAALLLMVGLSAAWFSLVAYGMSTAKLQAAYARAQRVIDRITGSIMLSFGGLLLLKE